MIFVWTELPDHKIAKRKQHDDQTVASYQMIIIPNFLVEKSPPSKTTTTSRRLGKHGKSKK